jgi:hypothetical protein
MGILWNLWTVCLFRRKRSRNVEVSLNSLETVKRRTPLTTQCHSGKHQTETVEARGYHHEYLTVPERCV